MWTKLFVSHGTNGLRNRTPSFAVLPCFWFYTRENIFVYVHIQHIDSDKDCDHFTWAALHSKKIDCLFCLGKWQCFKFLGKSVERKWFIFYKPIFGMNLSKATWNFCVENLLFKCQASFCMFKSIIFVEISRRISNLQLGKTCPEGNYAELGFKFDTRGPD